MGYIKPDSSKDYALILGASSGFGEAVALPLAGSPRDLVAHDFNGDGRDDLVVALYRTNEIALLEWVGDGLFEEVNRFASRGTLPSTVAVGDMNGDGNTDLLVGHRHADDSVVIFYGDGKFAFSVAQEIGFGTDGKRVEAGIEVLGRLGDVDAAGLFFIERRF